MRILVKLGFSLAIMVIALTFTLSPSQADLYFDFDSDFILGQGHTGQFHTQAGYTQVKPEHQYGGGNWFGWSRSLAPGRDRGALSGDPYSDLHRDLHFSSTPATFSVNIPNGTYLATLHFCDQAYAHDNIQVKAEGQVVLADVDVPAGRTR